MQALPQYYHLDDEAVERCSNLNGSTLTRLREFNREKQLFILLGQQIKYHRIEK